MELADLVILLLRHLDGRRELGGARLHRGLVRIRARRSRRLLRRELVRHALEAVGLCDRAAVDVDPLLAPALLPLDRLLRLVELAAHLHYITLHCIALHCIALQCIAVHYITN